MASSVSPQKSYKSSQEDENEYDPTQNWKMKKAKKKQKLTKESGLYNPNLKVKPELESQYNKQSKKSNSNKKYVTSYENSLNNVDDQDEDEYDPCKPAVQIKHKNKITDGHSSDADANGYHVPDYKSSSEDMYAQNSFSLQSNSHKRHQPLETVDHEEGCEYGSKHVKPPKKKSSSDLNSTQTLKSKEKLSVKRKSGGETLDESTSKKSKTSELKEKKNKNKGGNMSFEAL
uniref:Uncharacterized protein n=1 Tax=Ciona savignyi TaxID=51511 RepID=H2YW65_CIOSA